jgi:Zn-finger nucleic acid-binding protein
MKYLHVELKICEGCGALWLRRGTRDGVYCMACYKWLDGFPEPTGKRAGGRPRLARVKGCCAGRRNRGVQ